MASAGWPKTARCVSTGRLAGILTVGGTILGTSRDKPHRMLVDGEVADMTGAVVATYQKHRSTPWSALAAAAPRRTPCASSGPASTSSPCPRPSTTTRDDRRDVRVRHGAGHRHRGHRPAAQHRAQPPPHHRRRDHGPSRRLADSGRRARRWRRRDPDPGDPLQRESIAEAIRRRVRGGSNFSIVAVAEGAGNPEDAQAFQEAEARKRTASTPEEIQDAVAGLAAVEAAHAGNTLRLAGQLEALTGLESRVTILGYVQRGGTPSAADRLLATRLGSAGADVISEGVFGVMVAARGEGTEPVPLEQVAGKRNQVPPDHPWVLAARHVGTCLGD